MTEEEFDAIEVRVRSGEVSEAELFATEAKLIRTERERVLLNALGRPIMSDQEYQRVCKGLAAEEGAPLKS